MIKYYRRIYYLLLLLLVMPFLMATECGCGGWEVPFPEAEIMFENKSDEPIFVGWSTDFHITVDMVLNGASNGVAVYRDVVRPNEVSGLYMDTINNKKRLHVLIFKKTTLDSHSNQELIDKNLYDKKYDLTPDDVRNIDCHIIYDGKP